MDHGEGWRRRGEAVGDRVTGTANSLDGNSLSFPGAAFPPPWLAIGSSRLTGESLLYVLYAL